VGPAVLIAVALFHIYLVFTERLSPWKGGGFGMFSTIESPASRVLRIYLITGNERIPILLPTEFRDLEREIRTMPAGARLRQLAGELSQQAWAPYRLVSAEDHYETLKRRYFATLGNSGRIAGTERDVNQYSLENRAYLGMLFERMRFLRMLSKNERGQRSIPFERVEVEVWQMQFDQRTPQLRVEPIARESSKRP
jgi:hypothetical protein